MGKKTRSFVSAAALAGAFLFFGPGSSKAYAGHGPYAYRHAYRPHHGHFGHSTAYRPYRVVRVFVYAPYPRWIYRRVYYAPPVYAAPPAAGYCRPY